MSKMKTIALAVLMLAMLALPAGAVIQATSVEIRGEVHNYGTNSNVPNATGCANTTTVSGVNATCVAAWNATNFAAFWYDLKDDLKTESLVIFNASISASDRTIDSNTLWYNTTWANQTLKIVENGKATGTTTDFDKFEFSQGKYKVVGWQAMPYVAVKGKAKKLAKLVLEQGNASSEKKSLTIGETWDIGSGWTLQAQSIDAKASPRKAWIVISKDGVKKDDKVINDGAAYAYIEKSFAGESDVPLFATYVDSVFAGATSDMVQLRYTWAIDTSVTEIKTSDKFGNLEVQTADDDNIKLYNKDKTVSLSQDTTVDIFGDLKFKVADSSSVLRYYPMVLRKAPGTYEVRGSVVSGTGSQNWNSLTFAAFWYDLKDDLRTENLTVQSITTRTIASNTLWYNTTWANKTLKIVSNNKANGTDTDFDKFEFSQGKYKVVGWQAMPYVAVKGKAKKLAKLIIEQGNASSEKKSLTIGETWDLGSGWTVQAQSIDAKASPRKAWLVISKDGVKKDDKVINDGASYAYIEKSFAGESDVPLFATYVDSVFAGATSDMVQLRYTWAIDTAVTEIKTSDKFGNLEVQTADDDNIKLYNKDKTVTLSQDTTVDIFGDLKFKVADSTTLRYYPMVEYQIGDVVTPPGQTPGVTPGMTPGVTPGVTPKVNATATPAMTTPAMTEKATPAATTPAPAATPKEPGFEAVFAIAGLLAVAYLVLRQRK